MLKSNNLFSIGKEDHDDSAIKELDEQGSVSHADSEEVVAEVTVGDDTVEAGDNIGQATPVAEITPDSHSDITQTATEGGEASAEMSELLSEGKQAQATKDEIVEQAQAEFSGAETEVPDANLDENGNALTEEQAVANAEEDAVEDEVEEEVVEEAEAKDIHQEAAEADENSDEALSDAINEPETDGDLGEDAGESAEASQDGDFAGGGDASEGEDDQGDMGIDADLNDDTPLEGAEDAGGSDGTDDGIDDSATGLDTSGETSGEDVGAVADESAETTTEDEAGGEQVDSTDDVDTAITDQNAAAEVTDEATGSADAEADAELAGDGSNIEGEETMPVETPVEETEVIDGPKVDKYGEVETTEEQVAEAGPEAVVAADVEVDEAEVAELEDDTPLEGATAPLDVEVEPALLPTERDLPGENPTGTTVEESITDQTAEDLQDGVDAVADATNDVTEDAGVVADDDAPLEEPLAEAVDGAGEGQPDAIVSEPDQENVDDTANVEAAIDPEPSTSIDGSQPEGPDVEAGEVVVEDGTEANFEEGEVDVKDVDMDTTDEEVEEAMNDAAVVGEWGDKEEKEAELADKTIEELQKEKESLEKFRVLLEDGIANESYNAGLLAYMNAEMEPLRKKLAKLDGAFGITTPDKVSVESFGRDTDLAYVATLESFRGMISRVTTMSTGIAHRIEKWWSRSLVDKVTSRADALDKQIDLRLVELSKSGYTTSEVKGVRGYLATSETNLVKAVASDLNVTTDIAIKGIKASEQLQTTVIKAVNDIISAGNQDEIGKALDGLAALKNTKTSFPNSAFDKGLLGGWKLEIREGSGSDRAEKIEALGHTGIPVGVKAKVADESSTFNLSKGDIANLLKMAKTYVGVARKLANTTGDRAIGLTTKVRTTRTRALPITADTRVRGDEHGVDAAATAMKLLAQSHLDLYKFITKHCVEVADALCGVAAKAIK